MEVSVLLPTHNERENAPFLIFLLGKVLRDVRHEVIVIDDGSTDGTAEECRKVAATFGLPVKVFTRKEKHGLGNAYVRGIEHAAGKYVIIMDADLSHDPRDVLRLLSAIKATNASIVVGSRYAKGGAVINWPLRRKIVSHGANILARIFIGSGGTDLTNSLRIYKKDVLRAGITQVKSAGFSYQMEILFRCRFSPRIAEIPVVFHERASGTSKLQGNEFLSFLVHGAQLLFSRAVSTGHSLLYQ